MSEKRGGIDLLVSNGSAGLGLKTYPIFSGGRSEKMWKAINGARTIQDLSDTLYIICCNLQELETRIESKNRRAR